MPCTVEGSYTDSENLGIITQMLCYVCTRFDSGDSWKQTLKDNLQLRKWWEEHQKEDEERIKKEAKDKDTLKLRKKALEKLSAKERAALGLNETFA